MLVGLYLAGAAAVSLVALLLVGERGFDARAEVAIEGP
jgi:hypothetical protein